MKVAKVEHKRRLFSVIKWAVTILYSLCAASLLLSFIIPKNIAGSGFLSKIRRFLKLLGNYHEGVLLYMLMIFSAVLIWRGVRLLFIKLTRREKRPMTVHHFVAGLVVFALIIAVTVCGVFGAKRIHVTNYNVTVSKTPGTQEDLKIVLVSDLHLGFNIGVKHMQRMVSLINAEKPDLVLVAGDIFDNEIAALEEPEKLAKILASIESKYGVFACLGNHDIEEPILGGFTFGGKNDKKTGEEMLEFLKKANIRLLFDDYAIIDENICIYGRPDYSRPGNSDSSRKEISEIMASLDNEKCIIMLDHQPRELKEMAEAGVDIDLCGHTHDGQLFPLNLFQKWFMWENSCGYLKVGGMHNIVTSGVGLFGPNMRVGTKAEICVINVNFAN